MLRSNDDAVHTKALLDDLIKINSLFTLAAFIGKGFVSNDKKTMQGDLLIFFEVVSFSWFLFSTLLAKSLKIYLNIDPDHCLKEKTINGIGKSSLVVMSVCGLVAGVGCLAVSMVYVLLIKVGLLTGFSMAAMVILCALVIVALVLYCVSTVSFAVPENCLLWINQQGQDQAGA